MEIKNYVISYFLLFTVNIDDKNIYVIFFLIMKTLHMQLYEALSFILGN